MKILRDYCKQIFFTLYFAAVSYWYGSNIHAENLV